MKTMFLAILFAASAIEAAATTQSGQCMQDRDTFGCCLPGDKEHSVDKQTVFVKKSKNPFNDDPVHSLWKLIGWQFITLTRDGDSHRIEWEFADTEPPVFIIDAEHQTLPGVIRLGNARRDRFAGRYPKKRCSYLNFLAKNS